MSSLDGQDYFGSGPHTIRPAVRERAILRRSLPGLDGELVIDLGRRSRPIVQAGRLQAETAQQLAALTDSIEQLCDGRLHTLIDNHGTFYRQVLVESFEPTTPLSRGRGFWCDYTLRYRQLS